MIAVAAPVVGAIVCAAVLLRLAAAGTTGWQVAVLAVMVLLQTGVAVRLAGRGPAGRSGQRTRE